MRLTKLYSRIPQPDGMSLLDDLSDHYAVLNGNKGETLTLVSYFPGELRIGPELNFITNKYVLFVAGGDMASTGNTFGWGVVVRDPAGTDVTAQYELSAINNFSQEYAFLLIADDPNMDGYEVTVTCQANISGQSYNLSLVHRLAPIAADILALADTDENHAALGNPTCTYFIANHLRDYIRDIGSIRIGYINLSSAIIYKKILAEIENQEFKIFFKKINSSLFSNPEYSKEINNQGVYTNLKSGEIGVASIKLSILWMYFNQNNNFQRGKNLKLLLHQGFANDESKFIDLYLLAIFPKSAVKYSTEVFKMLFEHFKEDCDPSTNTFIYNTLKEGSSNTTLLNSWRVLGQHDLKLHPPLLLNIYTEYFNGPQLFVNTSLLTESFWRDSIYPLRHDWSSYLTKIISQYQVCPIDPNTRSHFVIHCTGGSMLQSSIEIETGISSNNRKRSKAHIYVMNDGSTIEVWPFNEKNVWATKIESQQNLKGRMFHVELNYGDPSTPAEEQYQKLADLYILASTIENCWPIIVPHIEVDRGLDGGHKDPTDFDYNHFYEILELKGVPVSQVTKFDHDRYWGHPTYKIPWATDTNSWPPILTGNPHE